MNSGMKIRDFFELKLVKVDYTSLSLTDFYNFVPKAPSPFLSTVIIPDEVVIPVHPADILGYHPLADLQWKRNVIYFIELVMNYTVK